MLKTEPMVDVTSFTRATTSIFSPIAIPFTQPYQSFTQPSTPPTAEFSRLVAEAETMAQMESVECDQRIQAEAMDFVNEMTQLPTEDSVDDDSTEMKIDDAIMIHAIQEKDEDVQMMRMANEFLIDSAPIATKSTVVSTSTPAPLSTPIRSSLPQIIAQPSPLERVSSITTVSIPILKPITTVSTTPLSSLFTPPVQPSQTGPLKVRLSRSPKQWLTPPPSPTTPFTTTATTHINPPTSSQTSNTRDMIKSEPIGVSSTVSAAPRFSPNQPKRPDSPVSSQALSTPAVDSSSLLPPPSSIKSRSNKRKSYAQTQSKLVEIDGSVENQILPPLAKRQSTSISEWKRIMHTAKPCLVTQYRREGEQLCLDSFALPPNSAQMEAGYGLGWRDDMKSPLQIPMFEMLQREFKRVKLATPRALHNGYGFAITLRVPSDEAPHELKIVSACVFNVQIGLCINQCLRDPETGRTEFRRRCHAFHIKYFGTDILYQKRGYATLILKHLNTMLANFSVVAGPPGPVAADNLVLIDAVKLSEDEKKRMEPSAWTHFGFKSEGRDLTMQYPRALCFDDSKLLPMVDTDLLSQTTSNDPEECELIRNQQVDWIAQHRPQRQPRVDQRERIYEPIHVKTASSTPTSLKRKAPSDISSPIPPRVAIAAASTADSSHRSPVAAAVPSNRSKLFHVASDSTPNTICYFNFTTELLNSDRRDGWICDNCETRFDPNITAAAFRPRYTCTHHDLDVCSRCHATLVAQGRYEVVPSLITTHTIPAPIMHPSSTLNSILTVPTRNVHPNEAESRSIPIPSGSNTQSRLKSTSLESQSMFDSLMKSIHTSPQERDQPAAALAGNNSQFQQKQEPPTYAAACSAASPLAAASTTTTRRTAAIPFISPTIPLSNPDRCAPSIPDSSASQPSHLKSRSTHKSKSASKANSRTESQSRATGSGPIDYESRLSTIFHSVKSERFSQVLELCRQLANANSSTSSSSLHVSTAPNPNSSALLESIQSLAHWNRVRKDAHQTVKQLKLAESQFELAAEEVATFAKVESTPTSPVTSQSLNDGSSSDGSSDLSDGESALGN